MNWTGIDGPEFLCPDFGFRGYTQECSASLSVKSQSTLSTSIYNLFTHTCAGFALHGMCIQNFFKAKLQVAFIRKIKMNIN